MSTNEREERGTDTDTDSGDNARCRYWLLHPPLDGNMKEMTLWHQWMLSRLPPPPPCPPFTPFQTATDYAQGIGAVIAPILQWRYARRAVSVKPNAVLTGLSCIPAVFAGFGISLSLSLPVMNYYNRSLMRHFPRAKAEDDPINYNDQAYLTNTGVLPWPLPLRDANDTQTVPDWVDSRAPNTDFDDEWSESRIEWKRRMAEEWRYTAEDVAARSKVLNSLDWCYLLSWCAGWTVYGSAVWICQKRRPSSNRLLFGFVVTPGVLPFIVGWDKLALSGSKIDTSLVQ